MVEQSQHGNVDKSQTPDVAATNARGQEIKEILGIYATLPEPRTQVEWAEWLRGTKVVEGDLDKKARLMMEFQRGVDYVETEAGKRGVAYARPAFGIVPADPSFSYRVGTLLGVRIFIATWYLEDFSRYDHEEPISFLESGESGKTSMYAGATVPQYLFLDGVEEAQHALFYQREGTWTSPPLHPRTTAGTLYDAQDHEYEALQWKIEAAKALGFPEKTVETLQHCLQEATAVRAKQAAARHAVARQATSEEPEGTAEETPARNSEDQEEAGDTQAAIPEDTPESTETWRDLPSSAQGLEVHRQGEDEQESDDHVRFEASPPGDSEMVGRPNLDSSNGGTSYRLHKHIEQDEINSSPAPDTPRYEHSDGGYDRN
jgi:hypothetical protein